MCRPAVATWPLEGHCRNQARPFRWPGHK